MSVKLLNIVVQCIKKIFEFKTLEKYEYSKNINQEFHFYIHVHATKYFLITTALLLKKIKNKKFYIRNVYTNQM